MKKYFVSVLASVAFIIMMAAGGTAEEHFFAGFILAVIAILMLGGVALLCKVWAKDLKKDVDDEE